MYEVELGWRRETKEKGAVGVLGRLCMGWEIKLEIVFRDGPRRKAPATRV
jgi:hypothetical protein